MGDHPVARSRLARVTQHVAVAGLLLLGVSPLPAITLGAKIVLLGVGWPTGTITYNIEAGTGVTRHAVEDVAQAVSDWIWALTLESFPDARMITLVPAPAGRAQIVIRLEVADGPVVSRVVHVTANRFSCELAAVYVELMGDLLGRPERHAGTRNVARHGLGHALGLGHSNDPTSVMHHTADSARAVGGTDIPVGTCEAGRLWMLHPPTTCSMPEMTLCY